MTDIQELIENGTEVIKALDEARHAHILAILALAEAEYSLALAGALAETVAVAAAGGEKALGANSEARKRALTIALGHNEVYQKARANFMQALSNMKLTQVQVTTLENTLGLLKASLYAGASRE